MQIISKKPQAFKTNSGRIIDIDSLRRKVRCVGSGKIHSANQAIAVLNMIWYAIDENYDDSDDAKQVDIELANIKKILGE